MKLTETQEQLLSVYRDKVLSLPNANRVCVAVMATWTDEQWLVSALTAANDFAGELAMKWASEALEVAE